MKKILFLSFALILSSNVFAQTHPFPQHVDYSGVHIKPSGYSQQDLDKLVSDYYDLWKTVYLKSSCGGGFQYFVSFDGGNACVSEGQGYGMMILPLMAGYEPNAQSYFDGLYKYYKAHPSSINANLMAWKQVNCENVEGDDAASDGDIDIAYGLLLAHVQWGSQGNINYLQEAKNTINAIMKDEINHNTWTVKLGDWVSSGGNYYYSTRTSDFIIDHFLVFKCAVDDNKWNNVVDTCYSLIENIQTNYSAQTGLLPGFIVNLDTDAKPASANFLEGDNDGNYDYNACRNPWRLTTDYLLFGDERAKNAVNKINNWLMNKTLNNPDNIKSGYKLNGDEIATWDDAAYVGPFTVGAMLNTDNQQWLDDVFAKLLSYNFADGDYYSNTIKLLNLIVISGNYWSPACDELLTGVQDIEKSKEWANVIYNQEYLYVHTNLYSLNLVMYDLNGKVLKTMFLNGNQTVVNIADVQKGCYIIQLSNWEKNFFYSKKMVFN